MGYLPTNKQIKEEVSNYDELTFFKKNKNILVVYILVLSAISDYLNYTAGTFIDVVFAIPIYLILIAFIFYNHRWAMIVICWLTMMDMFAMGWWFGTTEIIIAAIAVVLTYHSFRVATALKKKETYKYETLLKKVLKVILKVLVIFIVIGIVGDLFLHILFPTVYTDEELRIICNSHDYDELGKDALFVCMRVW